jgi:hypothetical protein
MPDIYVDIGPMTYNSDAKKADKKCAEKAKTAMRTTVEKVVKKTSGFTTQKKGPGFSLRLKVNEVAVSPKGVTCKMTGELLRYPKQETVSTSLTGSATAQGHGTDAAVMDCIEAVVEDMVSTKVIPVMKKLGH